MGTENIMKHLSFLICSLFIFLTCQGQVTTYFHGNKVQSKDETASLYSVSIYPNNTRVTIELIPTKNRGRMNYWSSVNTVIIAGGEEFPIVGFLRTRNGEQIVDTSPFNGNWGWEKVKKGETYRYTMVFDGAIPPGVTDFSLVDRGDWQGSHGYGFRNYTLNNPNIGATSFHSEYDVKKNIDENNDGICGIYEGFDNQGYKLACVKDNGIYKLIYLGMKEPKRWWRVGDLKATLRPSATPGYFKAEWYMLYKSLNTDAYVAFKGGSMETVISTETSTETSGYLKMYPSTASGNNSNGIPGITQREEWSGTGFAIGNGYLVTNYHVVENANSISIHGIKGAFDNSYTATVVATDKNNDLAILKISDNKFKGFGVIPYRVKTSTSDVGEDVFVLGYPLTTTMGEEIKLTTGVISSKTGFQGDVSMYQISAPVQPGNSGGPLFDGKGNIIGVVSAKHIGAENVGYAVKASYLNNLVETLSGVSLPSNNSISTLALSEKVKKVDDFVFLISCSTKANAYSSAPNINNSNAAKTINNPTVNRTTANRATIQKVVLAKDYTAVEIKSNNQTSLTGGYQWCNISRDTYILVNNGQRLTMTRAEGIKVAPEKTYFSYLGQEITFTLYFPPVSITASSFDLIESDDSEWKWYGISLK